MRDEDDAVEAELERLLNDPEVLLQPGRIWALADTLRGRMSLAEAAG